MTFDRDRLFARPPAVQAGTEDAPVQPEDFVFDDRVVRVFPDMIRRSVPGYGLIVPSTALLARRYAQDRSTLYDLGCSLGAATVAMQQSVKAQDVRIVAVDSSADMIARMRASVAESPPTIPITTLVADVCDVVIDNASVVVLNFTLQFIAPHRRAGLLAGIATGMRPGGALILSEKIRFDRAREQALQTEWHHDFKRAQGYSEMEIEAKREALENVMKPDSKATHFDRLHAAGFSESCCWFQCFSFASFIAIK